MAKQFIQALLQHADIQINGSRPWDITVHDERFYKRAMAEGSIGIGEAYMDGWWDCLALDQLVYQAMRAELDKRLLSSPRMVAKLLFKRLNILASLLFNMQNKQRALKVGKQHYDIGNDLYQLMLDQAMVYTCGYWKETDNLAAAQQAKLKLVCDKLQLKPGTHVLDIGCGWGSFAKYAAENYGVSVVGITISKEQLELGRERCKGLPVELRFQDYRDVTDKFDHIVSLGMFEHVGYKNYREYMRCAHRCLKDNGLFLLHTIGSNVSEIKTDDWVNKYIFPNGVLPSIKQIGKACEKLFVMEDWHNFGAYYDNTLQAWHKNFNDNWDQLKDKYGERFRRMWNFYLLTAAGSFRARVIQLWQIVLSKTGIAGGYHSIR